MSHLVESLVLGTAQFGGSYGISNRSGVPDEGRVRDILQRGYGLGVRTLDTAAAYGCSEEVLGRCGVDRWQVITKVPSLENYDVGAVGAACYGFVSRSLETLRIGFLTGVLLHDFRDSVGERGRRIFDALVPLIQKGHIGKIGVSIYAPSDLDFVESSFLQIVQSPMNVFDNRIVTSGEAARLRECGGELHVRSLFLQGLLLMSRKDRPKKFLPWLKNFDCFDRNVCESGLDPLSYCISFAANEPLVDRLVIGVESADQLEELVTAVSVGSKVKYSSDNLHLDDLRLIDPRVWRYLS